MMEYLDEYIHNIYVMDEMRQLQEINLDSIMKKILPKSKTVSLVKDVSSDAKQGKFQQLEKTLKRIGIPKVNQKTLDKIGKQLAPNYKRNKKVAQRVLENSLNASKKITEIAASALAVACTMKQGKTDNRDETTRLKVMTKMVVEKARKFYDNYEEADEDKKKAVPTDAAMDVAVGIAVVMSIAAVFSLSVVFAMVFLPKIIYMLIIIGIILAVISVGMAIVSVFLGGGIVGSP